MDLEVKLSFKGKSLGDCWSKPNTITKYIKLSATFEPFLLALQSSYIVEVDFTHANAILIQQRKRLDVKEFSDVGLKFASLQPNINTLVTSLQTHSSH